MGAVSGNSNCSLINANATGELLVEISTRFAISLPLGFAVRDGVPRGRESGETIEIYLNLDALFLLAAGDPKEALTLRPLWNQR